MKLVKESIQLPAEYSVDESALQFRQGLLMECEGITAISDPPSQAHAASVASGIKGHLNEVNAARTVLAAPLREGCDKLIGLERAYCEPLQAQLDRISRLETVFREAEEERVRQEEAARRAAIAKAEAEAKAAAHAAYEEQMRIQREQAERARAEAAAALVVAYPVKEEDAQADIRAAQQQAADDAADAARLEAANKAAQDAAAAARAAIVAPLPMVSKAKGFATREALCYEVTDLKKLYAARPELCTLEPNKAAIRATCVPGQDIPGLKLWYEKRSTTRAAR